MDNNKEAALARVENSAQPIAVLVSDLPAGHRVLPHTHRRGQLLHATSGVMIVRAEGGSWVVPPGRAVWVPAGVWHEIEAATGLVETRTVFVEPGHHPGLAGRACRVVQVSPLLRQLIVSAVALPLDYPAGGREERLMQLIVDELEHAPELQLHLPMPHSPRLADLCRAFLAEPARQVSLAGWAADSTLTPRTLVRRFETETGMTPGAWWRRARLLLSLPRLAEGMSVLDVALAHGYESPSAFTAAFRRLFGYAPQQYLRGLQGAAGVLHGTDGGSGP